MDNLTEKINELEQFIQKKPRCNVMIRHWLECAKAHISSGHYAAALINVRYANKLIQKYY